MLSTYQNLERNGVIGRNVKVGTDGKTPVYDPSGEQPGTLIPRAFQEFPKAVRRVKVGEDGKETVLTFVAQSKAEELRIMSETAELNTPLSPLEKERDELAQELATSQKMNGTLAQQLENALARINELANTVEKIQVAQQAPTPQPAPAAKSVSSAEALALGNKKQ